MKTAVWALAFLGFAVFSVSVKHDLRGGSPIKALQVGQPMPDFTLPDTAGNLVTLSDVVKQNKLVVINFWASCCGPCRLEMPGFEKLYASKKAEGFVLLGVNVDAKRPDMDEYLKRKPVTFPVLLDTDSAVMKKLGVRVLPTTIVVEADGSIDNVTEGIHQFLATYVEFRLEALKEKKK
jgi:peroxiredoxin